MTEHAGDEQTSDAAPCVWGVGTSRTLRAHWTLCELAVDYTWQEIIPRTESMDAPAFREVSQRGKVPILEHGRLVIGESGAIMLHLADHYRDRAVLAPPPETAERAVFHDRFIFTLMELDAPLYIIRRHEGLADVYGESKVAAASAREYFLRQSGVVCEWLEETGFVFGASWSAADIMLATCTAWAELVGIELAPPLAKHLEAARARDAFGLAAQRNFPPAALAMLAAQRPPAAPA
ncbi:MAG: glutathione S-transferase family protein [Myxococcota bacterium]|jgi:glutathione S-transferase|nr:glutathione S-transferase family protein [Myxococcota bacterium]